MFSILFYVASKKYRVKKVHLMDHMLELYHYQCVLSCKYYALLYCVKIIFHLFIVAVQRQKPPVFIVTVRTMA